MSGTKAQYNPNVEDSDNLKLSHFKLLGLLGDGAYGEVWKARHKLTGQFFAIKIVAKEKVSSALDQFNREIRIMSSLSHPNIIKLYQHFEDSSFFYLVMELAENGTLRDKISILTPLPEPEIQTYFWQLLLAVDYLHSHMPPIIHRDIKPENIMFDNQNSLKLCDFGFSNYYDQERKTSCGTLEYLSPEIVERRSHDTSVDVWSLGILLYEMFTSVTPFSDGTNQQVLSNISKSLLRVPLNIPPLAKDLISLMLDRNQDRRFTVSEIRQHRWLKIFQSKNEKSTGLTEKPKKKSGIFTPEEFLLNPSPKDLKNSMVFSFRKSINCMKNEILHKSSGVKNTKTLVSKHRTMLSVNLEKLKETEKDLERKKKEFTEVASKEKIILSKIKDADYDIARLMNVCEVGVFKQKVLDFREEYLQKVKEFEIQSEILKNLRQQVKITTISTIEKEEELRELRKNLNTLREDLIKSFKDTEIQVRELKEYSNFLKTKLKMNENPIPLTGPDLQLSNDIVTFISDHMESNKDDLSLHLKRLLMQTESKSKTLEKKLAGLKTEISEEREKIINDIKKKKDLFFSGLKRLQHLDHSRVLNENRAKESEILVLIEQSRLKEKEKNTDLIDIAIARNKLYVIFK
jgi:aurora kinase